LPNFLGRKEQNYKKGGKGERRKGEKIRFFLEKEGKKKERKINSDPRREKRRNTSAIFRDQKVERRKNLSLQKEIQSRGKKKKSGKKKRSAPSSTSPKKNNHKGVQKKQGKEEKIPSSEKKGGEKKKKGKGELTLCNGEGSQTIEKKKGRIQQICRENYQLDEKHRSGTREKKRKAKAGAEKEKGHFFP